LLVLSIESPACLSARGSISNAAGLAALLLFPSIYEGFGWPPLEAMACGCPVVCSTAGSLPEVVGDAAFKCNVEDYEQMAKNCIAVLEDAGLAGELVQKGYEQIKKFSLERMGRELLSVYMKAIRFQTSTFQLS